VLDASDPDHRLIAQYEANRVTPLIPLGTRGTLDGQTWEVIGYLVREVVDEPFTWCEYLLHNPLHGQRWLVEYHGHWTLTRLASGVPRAKKSVVTYQDVTYRHFQSARAQVRAVVGEFPWTPRVGERARVEDYVAPPRMLSVERNPQETTWSTAEYVDGGVVWKAFGLPGRPPERIGVGACQPSPYAAAGRPMFLLLASFLALAVLVHLLFAIFSQQRLVADVNGDYRPGTSEAALVVSEPFPIGGRTSNVMVEISTNVANSWAYFNLTLVNEDTGLAKSFGREVGYYAGRDSDGAWSEGANWDRAYLPAVVSGSYVLLVEPEGPYAVSWRVRLTRDVPRPLWLWLALGALVIPPALFLWRKLAFESRRWSESDHSAGSGSDDD
jgi:hypothetical protein